MTGDLHAEYQSTNNAPKYPDYTVRFNIMEQHIEELKTMNASELTTKFGRCIHDKELADYLGMDVRTLRKHADDIDGIKFKLNRYYFFEKHLEGIIYAKPNNKEREEKIQSKRTSAGEKKRKNTKQKNTKVVSRRQQKVTKGRSPLGKNNERTVREPDRHNLRKFI